MQSAPVTPVVQTIKDIRPYMVIAQNSVVQRPNRNNPQQPYWVQTMYYHNGDPLVPFPTKIEVFLPQGNTQGYPPGKYAMDFAKMAYVDRKTGRLALGFPELSLFDPPQVANQPGNAVPGAVK